MIPYRVLDAFDMIENFSFHNVSFLDLAPKELFL